VTPLLASLQQGFEALPPALRDAGDLAAPRRAALDRALADGLPGPRSERWKYTPLRAFERRQFGVAAAITIDPALLEAIPAPRMVFVNGHFDAGLSQLDGLPEGVVLRPLSRALNEQEPRALAFAARLLGADGEAFERLNSALAAEGVLLHVDAGVRAHAPLHLVFAGAAAADAAWHLASLIELGADAELCVVEHHLAAGEHAHFCTARVEVELAAGSRLSHARLQDAATGASLVSHSTARLAERSAYRRLDLELGAALSRHELSVELRGAQAELTAHGVLLADGRRHLDTRIDIAHIAGDTRCDLNWRGLGAARGRAVFHGGITIHPGADGSAAALSNKNLLLSEAAEIDTQPVLVIHADEVKAAHGATVGQLDDTALFYLRSRGLPLDEARRLLTVAFCREPLAAIEDSALTTLLAAHLDARLHAGGAL
jgi:Fe-S cluster assembly protein SufD